MQYLSFVYLKNAKFFIISLKKFDEKLQHCGRVVSAAHTRGSRLSGLSSTFRKHGDDLLRCVAQKVTREVSSRWKRDSRTNTRLNLTELSSTLELPRPHTEGDRIRHLSGLAAPPPPFQPGMFRDTAPAVRIGSGRGK